MHYVWSRPRPGSARRTRGGAEDDGNQDYGNKRAADARSQNEEEFAAPRFHAEAECDPEQLTREVFAMVARTYYDPALRVNRFEQELRNVRFLARHNVVFADEAQTGEQIMNEWVQKFIAFRDSVLQRGVYVPISGGAPVAIRSARDWAEALLLLQQIFTVWYQPQVQFLYTRLTTDPATLARRAERCRASGLDACTGPCAPKRSSRLPGRRAQQCELAAGPGRGSGAASRTA